MRSTIILGVLITTALAACGSEEVIHNLSERDANRILQLLHDGTPPIEAVKLKEEGGRFVVYKIVVPAKSKHQAYELLNAHELPRPVAKTRDVIYSSGGLIPTKSEEIAKKLASTEGEIEAQLQLIPNVLEARVNVVMPEDNPLRQPGEGMAHPSASITLKYMPLENGQPPLSEVKIKELMSAAIEGMRPEHVVVFLAPRTAHQLAAAADAAAAALPGAMPSCPPIVAQAQQCKGNAPFKRRFGMVMCPETSNLINMIFVIAAFLIMGAIIGMVALGIRSKTIKSRLMRLQAELAGARKRRGGGSGVIPAPPGMGVDVESGEKSSV